jgi:GNAT superfamily N-acetyltransferase
MSQTLVIIRPAALPDAQEIAEVHIRAWQWAYRGLIDDDYLDHLSDNLDQRIASYQAQFPKLPPQNRWWVAEQDGHIVGFAMTGLSRDPDVPPLTAEVFAIYLNQQVVGKGVGRALFARAVDELRNQGYAQVVLWVLESNTRARKFYEAAGWTPDGAHKTEERPGGRHLDEVRYRIVLKLE